LALGDVIYEPGGRMEHVYFPTGAVVSLIYTMADAGSAEMGLVGNEGVVGIALFMGGETPNQAVVQVAGGAVRMRRRRCSRSSSAAAPLSWRSCATSALIEQRLCPGSC
jgi:hypothetical protein